MKIIADLHIHSPYARAVSKNMTLENLDHWAAVKGITVMGTGDFTHPKWMTEIKEKLEPAEPGLYALKSEIINQKPETATRFMLTVEISSIYKKGGKVRRIHNLIFAPSVETAEKINAQLGWRGNLASDGRPILGMDSEELAKVVFNIDAEAGIVPAHAWTPWFSVFGSMSGFDSLAECFGEFTPQIFAIETGLSCYDIGTEVLTKDGWKKFSQVTKGDEVCTLNLDTNEVEYQHPKKVYRSKYRGKMYRLKTKRADLLVTPNHNLLYAPADFRTRRPFRLKEASVLFRKSKILRKDGIWRGGAPPHFTLPAVKIRHGSRFYSGFRAVAAKKFPMEPWLKFFGFWIAEGWTTQGRYGDYAVCVSNRDYKLMAEIKMILEGLGYRVFWDKKTTNTIRVRDYQLFSYLRQFGKAADKHVPAEVKGLSKELLKLFLGYYLKGDGHVYGRNGKGLSATTISTRLRDDLQEIALKVGISAYYKLHNKKGTPFSSPSQKSEYRQSADSWTIYFIRKNRHAIIPSEMKKYGHREEWIDYDGMVYCVSVPNRVIYVRRNGIPLWCGNSDPAMNWRLSALDRVALISNSDSHSLQRIGREANVFDCELSYAGMMDAIKSHDQGKFLFTVEFFPEEGKYHYDGHSEHKVRMSPEETKRVHGQCPTCGRPVTVGVMHRVEALADRPLGAKPPNAIPFKSMVPLDEIIGEAFGMGVSSKKVKDEYQRLIGALGSEFRVLFEAGESDLTSATRAEVVEGIRRVRDGRVTIEPGYDGTYGTVKIFDEADRKQMAGGQSALF